MNRPYDYNRPPKTAASDSPFAKKQLKELEKSFRDAESSLDDLKTDLSDLMEQADKMMMRSEDMPYEREASEVLGPVGKAYMTHLKEVDALLYKARKSLDKLSRMVK